MADINAANGASANTSPQTSNSNQHDSGQQATTPSTRSFHWSSAKDGVLVSLIAANSSYTHFPRWTQFAMACKNFGLGVPYHLSDDDLLTRCHELKSTLEEWDLVVNARKRPKDEFGYLAYLKGYRSERPATQGVAGSRSTAGAGEHADGTSEDAADRDEPAAASNHDGPQDANKTESSGSSSGPTQQKKQRQTIVKKIETKKRARKRQANIVIQGNFDFFNIKKTTRGSKKTVSFKGEGTVNVPF